MVKLGNLCETGDIVKKNLKRAVEWYEKAVDSGSEGIKLRLAQIYAYGDATEGLPANYGKAMDLLNSLSENDSVQAKMLRNFVEQRLRH
jgi:TPR repeat protein